MSEAAGWYPDPWRVHEYRYHDGRVWTGTVADQGRSSFDPLPPGDLRRRAPRRRCRWAMFGAVAVAAAVLVVMGIKVVGSDGGTARTKPATGPAIAAWVARTRDNLFADDQILIDITRDQDPSVCRTDLQSFRDRFSDFFPTPWPDLTAALRSLVRDESSALDACAAAHQSADANDATANDLANVRTQIHAHGFNADPPG